MTSFAIIGHLARTDGGFSLNDLPGSGGRMDVLCRCVNASLFLSHDLRRDVDCYLILCGEPAGPKTVKFSGALVRSLSPDERSAGALVKKVIDTPCGSEFREAAQGVFIRKGGLERLLTEHRFAVLDEKGTDIRKATDLTDAFILSDHLNFTDTEEALLRDCPRYSVGPKCLHADHTITVLHNELDRRTASWT
ncbi:MAG: tRNA (pseudouridine(54)-N(1))-methyltransferase TrmY [Methanomicrobiales archaeon HGW-Methanomicrobiales-3]|jgi:tRNA (pseudouridine54-N1)-methyltransferase|nr:MAG: tRNA (pseudouridine(54)-N(1))-methyltransferase TrmY [Methanomicrobiales archaeon HGW-Methanomicrobiales-3]